MKNSIKVVGFADAAGNGAELPAAFSEADFEKAKRVHQYPKGVKHMKLLRVEEIDCAVFIGENVGEHFEKAEAIRAAALKAAASKEEIDSKIPDALAAAQKRVRDAARVRNDLMGRLHTEKAKLRNHELTPEGLRSKDHIGAIQKIQTAIFGDPEKKVAGLEKQVADAVAEYDKATAEAGKLTEALAKKLTPAAKSQFAEA